MREIKFRAFDTEKKAWTFVTLGDLICGACTENGDKPLSGAKQVWEQYTGLKDKNGKEIYEGDIVKCGPYSARPIVFEEGRYWLGEEPDDLFFSSGFFHGGIEVIGNIHENPELLEEEE